MVSDVNIEIVNYGYILIILMAMVILAFLKIMSEVEMVSLDSSFVLVYRIFSITTLVTFAVLFLRDVYSWYIPLDFAAYVLVINSYMLAYVLLQLSLKSTKGRFILAYHIAVFAACMIFSEERNLLIIAALFGLLHYNFMAALMFAKYRNGRNTGHSLMAIGCGVVGLCSPIALYHVVILLDLNFAYTILAGTLMMGYTMVCLGFLTYWLVESQRKLNQIALVDPLTELLNRRGLKQALDNLKTDRTCKVVSLLIGDIDHFKTINDSFGHDIGDDVLRAIADILQSSIRSNDVCARMGGEEFAIILHNTDGERAQNTANRIRKKIESFSFVNNDVHFSVTSSFGLTTGWPTNDFQRMLNLADQALYQAKESGRNKVIVQNEPGLRAAS